MVRMSEHTGLISPYQLLIIAACTNTGGKMKGSHLRPADRCPFVLGHSISQVTSFMQLGMLCMGGSRKKRGANHDTSNSRCNKDGMKHFRLLFDLLVVIKVNEYSMQYLTTTACPAGHSFHQLTGIYVKYQLIFFMVKSLLLGKLLNYKSKWYVNPLWNGALQ